jgi:hypothetical protein
MPKRLSVPLLTLAIGLPAFALGPVLWPQAAASPRPSDGQLPFFVLLSLVEALLFGLGVAFLAFDLPLVRQAAQTARVNPWPVYLAVAWQLVSWWPHDNLHIATGLDYGPLLLIEYAFHGTLIVSALIVAGFFLAVLRGASGAVPRRA